jgi:hypothetical protein
VVLTRFSLESGGSVTVETEDVHGVAPAARRERVLNDARTSFEQGVSQVRDAAVAALAQFQAMTRQPNEVEIKFGVKFDAEVGAVIARTGVEGHLEITLTWHSDQPGEPTARDTP